VLLSDKTGAGCRAFGWARQPALNETKGSHVMQSLLKRSGVVLAALFALGAVTAVPALASEKPSVETKPATVVGETSSTLNGTVNPNGAETKYHFQYGTTTFYGSSTSEASAGSGSENLPESSNVTGLKPFTTYHFRVVATNSNGTAYGADEVFWTKAAPGLPEFSNPQKEGFPVSLKGHGGNVVWRQTSGTIQCESSSMSGSVSGVKTLAGVTIAFSHCIAGGASCRSEGSEAGHITTEPLEGRPVYLSKTAKTVGILFIPQTGKAIVHKILCALHEGEVTGSFVMPITSVNKMESHFTLKEEVGKYENGKGEKETAGLSLKRPGEPAEALGCSFESSLETGHNIEIKA
jgi:hypothetical protein